MFHEVRFPARLSFGSSGGPERLTEVVELANGFEERNTPWADSRRRYDAGVGVRSLDDMAALIAFFEARRARLHGFRWKDWADWHSGVPSEGVRPGDQVIGVGDGVRVEWPLAKTYRSGAHDYVRTISKPVEGTVRIALADDELREGDHWTVDVATGLVTFLSPPEDGAEVTAGFEFDVPVRFDTDALQVTAAGFEAGEVPSVPVVEIRA
ncbi:DUF2460 domain-containing protein [Jannaschia sp. Os4]|uniref:DUF2460 domain-containing protein n=1 Tax=Jannaschia sp. Os4 TaxID=2807617 RepID=UPI00193A8F88|nr:DUF2460 domain-containing protein [Jannaschia sp. Os4]MBM2576809.1 DUF2460 domain-containing protein [Jannaschia sp. Os4]